MIDIEAIAKLLRDIQREHGRIPKGTKIVGPEWFPDILLGFEVVRCETLTTPTLSCPAHWKQARDFEDYFPEEDKRCLTRRENWRTSTQPTKSAQRIFLPSSPPGTPQGPRPGRSALQGLRK